MIRNDSYTSFDNSELNDHNHDDDPLGSEDDDTSIVSDIRK